VVKPCPWVHDVNPAAAHGMHRKDSPLDIVIFGVIGVVLLVLLPAKQPSPAPISEPRLAER